jgi:hypothetical protein
MGRVRGNSVVLHADPSRVSVGKCSCHPDVCSDPNAASMFIAVKEAYNAMLYTPIALRVELREGLREQQRGDRDPFTYDKTKDEM